MVKKLWCNVAAGALLDLGLNLPHVLLHRDGDVCVAAGFVQYPSVGSQYPSVGCQGAVSAAVQCQTELFAHRTGARHGS